jgi:hypothetical protein
MKVMLHRITALVMALGTSLSAWAYPNSSVSTHAYVNPHSPLSDSEALNSTSGAPLTSRSEIASYTPYWTLSAESRAHVQPSVIQLYGNSQASASIDPSASIYSGLSYVTVGAQTNSRGHWQDSFTIDGGVLNGSVGHLVAAVQVNGTFNSGYDASLLNRGILILDERYNAQVRLYNIGTYQDVRENGAQRHLVSGADGDRWVEVYNAPFRAPGLWTIAIDFKFGTPIDVDMHLGIEQTVIANACNSIYYGPGCLPTSYTFSTIDFGHTMFWCSGAASRA